jgi:plasmid stabilization system protein ParE
MSAYVFHPEAEAELRDAALYYEDRRSGLGKAFLAEVRRTINLLLANPGIGTALEGAIRRRALRRFPDNLIYPFGRRNDCNFCGHASEEPTRILARPDLTNVI